jgi:molybdopterin synthase catalytic subunit
MRVRVLFFGLLKDLCGKSEDHLDLAEGATARAVFEHYASQFPALANMARSIVLARNHEFADASQVLAEGDEIALLPPVSGGSRISEITDPDGSFYAITREPIDARAIEARLLQGIDGAIVTFHGVVRNNTRGRATLRLEYECYEGMAIRIMAQIGRDIAGRLPISRIAMAHRLGTMEIGEASVVVVAVAPHRRPAFDAALEGINKLKSTVPIWKKEFFEDGEVWVEGEWDDKTPRVAP